MEIIYWSSFTNTLQRNLIFKSEICPFVSEGSALIFRSTVSPHLLMLGESSKSSRKCPLQLCATVVLILDNVVYFHVILFCLSALLLLVLQNIPVISRK